MGTSVTARMKPREKLMRAVQPNSTARYKTATSFRTFHPCSVPCPVRSLEGDTTAQKGYGLNYLFFHFPLFTLTCLKL